MYFNVPDQGFYMLIVKEVIFSFDSEDTLLPFTYMILLVRTNV